MVRPNVRLTRAFALGFAAVLVLAACNAPSSSPSGEQSGEPSASQGESKAGGTIFVLSQNEQWNQIDPQRAYTGEDLAFFSGTIYRSLTAYKFSGDPVEGTSLVPDMATNLGTPNADASSWSFTLRDGITWQDGSEVTCEDIKYGVSRTFATDVINQGPTYAIAYLDIPTLEDGSSAYKGPYSGEGQDLFDQAVTCDGKTITFNLSGPVADFNYTTTLGFGAVPEAADCGETYGQPDCLPWSNGPYMVESYSTGNGGKFVLVRNPNWDKASDPYRPAYPDKWEVQFGIDPKVMDQRLIAASGNDQFAVQYGNVQPENLATIFENPDKANPDFEGRAISGFDPYARYYYIDVNKIPNVKHRQAMAVALDREGLRLNIGGAFAGTFGDGVIKPNIGADYAPTGMWEDMFGQAIPDGGDPDFAAQLIEESGETPPPLVFNHADTPVGNNNAAIVIASLEAAGFTVTPNPIEPGKYYSVVFDPGNPGNFGTAGWGADWPNASTVIPPLFTFTGGWNLSQVDDADWVAQVNDALTELDRSVQATKWQELNQLAMERVYVIPTFFGLSQTLAGTKVAPAYRWAAYGSWPYGEMYVIK